MHSYFCSLVVRFYPTLPMSKSPLFAGAASASNTVDLLSDSLDDEDLRAVSTFSRRPGNDDEQEVQFLKTKKKPVSQMKMPPPFAAFVREEGKDTHSRVGVAGSSNNKSAAVEKFTKKGKLECDAANLHFEMDPTFESLETGSGPNGRIYRWLRAQQYQVDMFQGYLKGNGTKSQWDLNSVTIFPYVDQ